MRTRTNQSGFSVVELVIILAVIGVLGFVGYNVYNRQNSKTADSSYNESATNESAKADDVAATPAAFSSTSDLDGATAILDQTDPSGSNNTDAGQLDSQLANF